MLTRIKQTKEGNRKARVKKQRKKIKDTSIVRKANKIYISNRS